MKLSALQPAGLRLQAKPVTAPLASPAEPTKLTASSTDAFEKSSASPSQLRSGGDWVVNLGELRNAGAVIEAGEASIIRIYNEKIMPHIEEIMPHIKGQDLANPKLGVGREGELLFNAMAAIATVKDANGSETILDEQIKTASSEIITHFMDKEGGINQNLLEAIIPREHRLEFSNYLLSQYPANRDNIHHEEILLTTGALSELATMYKNLHNHLSTELSPINPNELKFTKLHVLENGDIGFGISHPTEPLATQAIDKFINGKLAGLFESGGIHYTPTQEATKLV